MERNLQRIAERAAGEKDKQERAEDSGVVSEAKKRKKFHSVETEEERNARRLKRKLLKREARLLREAENALDGSEEKDRDKEGSEERGRERGREGLENKKMKKFRNSVSNHEKNNNGEIVGNSSSSKRSSSSNRKVQRSKEIDGGNEVEVISDGRQGHKKSHPGDDLHTNSNPLIDTESSDRSSDSDSDSDSYSSSEGFDDSEYEDTHDYDEPELRDDDEGIAFRNDDTEGIHKIFLMKDTKIRFSETG